MSIIDSLTNALAGSVGQHPFLFLFLLLVSPFDLVILVLGQLVTFIHKLRLLWRRLREEPNADLLKL